MQQILAGGAEQCGTELTAAVAADDGELGVAQVPQQHSCRGAAVEDALDLDVGVLLLQACQCLGEHGRFGFGDSIPVDERGGGAHPEGGVSDPGVHGRERCAEEGSNLERVTDCGSRQFASVDSDHDGSGIGQRVGGVATPHHDRARCVVRDAQHGRAEQEVLDGTGAGGAEHHDPCVVGGFEQRRGGGSGADEALDLEIRLVGVNLRGDVPEERLTVRLELFDHL